MDPILTQHVDSLTKLVEAIQEHNAQYSHAARIARSLGGLFAAAMQGVEPGATLEEASTGAPSLSQADLLGKNFARFLGVTGLELVHNRGEIELHSLMRQQGIEATDSKASESHSISFEIKHSDRLVNFFNNLKARDVERDGAKEAILFLAEALDEDFVHAYCQAQLDSEVRRYQELIDPLAEITSELRRLNMQEHAAVLGIHVERAIEGDLSAFLLAESHGFLMPGRFHAGTWHTDSNPDAYQRRWTEALDVAELMRGLPKSEQIFSRVHRYLSDCATNAQSEISEKLQEHQNEQNSYWHTNGPGMLAVLGQVLLALAIMHRESE